MSATLLARDLGAGHGDKVLFSGLNLVVAPGQVVGLVGANGAAKSTLLRTLAGLQPPSTGSMRVTPPDAIIGWLPQEVERPSNETILGYLERRTGVAQAQRQLDAATADLAGNGENEDDNAAPANAIADAYAAALDHWLAIGGADLADRTGQALAEVGLGVADQQLMTTLSGGQAARVGLAALLLSRWDVLLLDEPTNDLDLDGLARLETFVADQRGGIVLVSHDSEFLANCVTVVVDLAQAQQLVAVYGGGYQSYLDERERSRQHRRV